MKITFSMSVCVRNITFDRFSKIFEKITNVENLFFPKSSKTHVEPVKKLNSRVCLNFSIFDNFQDLLVPFSEHVILTYL